MTRYTDAELEQLWQDFGDTPLQEDSDNIDEPVLYWEVGTDRFEIWHWFDEMHSKGLVEGLMPWIK